MAPKSDESDRAKKVKTEKTHDVPWKVVDIHVNHEAELCKAVLNMPSVIPLRYQKEWVATHTVAGSYKRKAEVPHPVSVVLDLLAKANATSHALTIMRDCCTRNILKARLVFNGESSVLAWAEPFTGRLMDYLQEKELGISEFLDSKSEFNLPTPNLHIVISQTVDGLEQLCLSGLYHGGFSFDNSYYFMEEGTGALTVKLANFMEQGGPYKNQIFGDWCALKDGLVKIRQMAIRLKEGDYPRLNYMQLDGLIHAIGNINKNNAESSFEQIKRHPFFWLQAERKEFFINDIPLALARDDFFSKVKKAEFIKLPWGHTKVITGLLDEMNKYRSIKGKTKYNTNDRVDYVKFISGLYTHEVAMKLNMNVDAEVQSIDPGLCYSLFALMHNIKTNGN